ncbi:MAG: hypothetical protein PHH00_04190 [Candidatus Nanoarchaeia archaeon]|nr:hypothetical protein [Candidatus Nanoarchaeia archaeon]
MSYDFIDGSGGYSFGDLKNEVQKFDDGDLINKYNQAYINARGTINWQDLSASIDKKIQFLIDWKTDYVRIHQQLYYKKMEELAAKQQFIQALTSYMTDELPNIDLSCPSISSDIKYIYEVADYILKPTAASKILHMFNPNLFPIWDMRMRENLFHTRSHKPIQYQDIMSKMQKEINIVVKNAMTEFHIMREDALKIIKQLDKPTYSILRIMDKVNYNNSRYKRGNTLLQSHDKSMEGGNTRMRVTSGGKENTGLRLSDFLKSQLPNISSFSMNKLGGFTFSEEQQLWREGKMTASFLKQVCKMLQYQTYQVSNYDLLQSLKNNRDKLIKVLRERPELDQNIVIKSKGKSGIGSGTLKSGLLD